MSSECIMCKLPKEGEVKIIYENDSFYCIFDAFPVSPGHALVISKRHEKSVFELTEAEWKDLRPAILSTKEIIETTDFRKLYDISDIKLEKKKEYFMKIREKNNDFKDESIFGKERNVIKGYNSGNNTGSVAGMTIFHFHFHIIPRFEGDVENPIGGIRNVIPVLGNYKK